MRQIVRGQEDAMTLRLSLRYRGQTICHAAGCACHSRRAFLAGAGAVGAATILSPVIAEAEATTPKPRTVD
jgi:hypothetical protein